jgi:dUTP pyrophosphatase
MLISTLDCYQIGGEILVLKVKRVTHEGVAVELPAKATQGSAGFDLYAAIATPVTIEPGGLVSVPTGIAIGFPEPQYAGLILSRSGLATRHGIALANGVGLIDSDYTGELTVGLCNVSKEPYTLEPGERFAQLVVIPIAQLQIIEAASLDDTERSDGGFGSTGRF